MRTLMRMAAPLTLTLREILKLHAGLAALDGIADKTGAVERFTFDEGTVWAITKNRKIVEREVDTYEDAKAKLGKQLAVVNNMPLTADNASNVAAFMEQEAVLLKKTVDVPGLLKLSRTALQKAGVRTPGILANLFPILEDK